MNPIQDKNLSPLEALQLAKAMVAVARVDGFNPAEEVLIRQFYESTRTDSMPTTNEFIKASSEALTSDEDLTLALKGCSPAFAETLVMMCFMAGYADGRLSDGELLLITKIATAAGVDSGALAACRAQVQDALLGSLAHLPDSGSVANVFDKL